MSLSVTKRLFGPLKVIIWLIWFFDSRPPKIKTPLSEKQNIWQSFLGYKVKLNNSVLDEDTCTLMDFNVVQDGATQFVYVLPYSTNEALIELTRFGKEKIDVEMAENDQGEVVATFEMIVSVRVS
ncbi:lycopene cyclase family protein, partial [Crocinitomicaceae bacterium]|nr:lycopene cyclase family protein [Crocinitomicaceae bacterium]